MLKKLILLSIISSCSFFQAGESTSKKAAYKNYLVKQITPKWFTVDDSSSLKNRDGVPLSHLFFDTDPNINLNKKTLDFVVLTPQGSKSTKNISLLSGQTYMDKELCPIKDVWNEIKKTSYKPNFTMGFVPRLFNQINEPQKIIVFGSEKYYQSARQNSSHQAKLVGGVIYQTCSETVCTSPNQWLSSLLLIAVSPEDQRLKESKDLTSLFKKVDWDYSKVFLESSLGVKMLGNKLYGSNRVSSLISLKQVNKLIKKHSLFWSVNKIKSLKSNCLGLYSKISKSLNNKRIFDYMREDYSKTHNQIKTCLKYVYPKSINESSEEFIFYAHLQAYQSLHNLGYFYSCHQGGWQSNPLLRSSNRAVINGKYQKRCSDEQLDRAFQSSVLYLDNLLNKLKPSLRFLTYDNWSKYPSYNKHYAWVPFDGRVSGCKNEDLVKFPIQMSPVYPRDLRWKSLIKKSKTSDLIIR